MILIAKDVFHIPLLPRNSINVYVVNDILIDAGTRNSYKKILHQLGTHKISAHALTHAHADHQGSSHTICKTLNIPLWCSLQEKPQAETGDATREYPKQNHLVTKFQKKFWAGEAHPVARILKEGDKVADFVVIETPGHSSGHLSFFRENDGLLIIGDTAVHMNLLTTVVGLHQPPGLFTLDQQQNISSIKKLASLQPKVLAFGHGPVLKNKGEFEQFAKKL